MDIKNLLLTSATALIATAMQAQQTAARFDMSLTSDGKITENVTSTHYAVNSQLPAFTVDSPDGQALRFDGYSNYVKAAIPVSTLSTEELTVSVTLAAETYPMMKVDVAEDVPSYATICGNLDETAKKGFALELSSQGDLRFRYASTYAKGTILAVSSTDEKLRRGVWNEVTVVLNKAANSAVLYINGEQKGTRRMNNAPIVHNTADFYIGKNANNTTDPWTGKMLLNTFCGLIDDITISNAVASPEVASIDQMPDFSYPLSRYGIGEASQSSTLNSQLPLWRPLFHGMPSGAWTNETHGMTYSDGRYHLFFQKNANGPYMSRLHWGHISSENLYQWREEPIAIAPGESYDLKGCWSGCVYEQDGTPYILYTAVDNARATIAQARPTDASLAQWEKQGIVIDGTPAGGFQDFRDPYYFEAGGQKYVIVGTGKGGVGCCTLHRLENGKWTNNGTIFFQGTTASQHGTFWEMPNVTPMGGGKYLFTCTPLGTAQGVRTLCWVGTIGSDGRFQPDASGMQYLEMNGISRDGYGLLSPTICQQDGRTLLLGIVPDKLPTQTNLEMGWAHNYSLPREVSLDADGLIVQKPYSGLSGMRTPTSVARNLALNGSESLAPVSGRQLELQGEFTVGSGEFGFRFLKSGDSYAALTYNPANGELRMSMNALKRQSNGKDEWAATLPQRPQEGQTLKLHVFVDGSIADIFVADRWAFSVRLFPTDAAGVEAEAFAAAPTAAKLSAWTLDPTLNGSDGIESMYNEQCTMNHACYDLQGRRVAMAGMKPGIYIINGKKTVLKR